MGTPIGVEIHFQLEIAAPVKVQPRDAAPPPLLCHWLNHQLVEYMYDKYKHIIY